MSIILLLLSQVELSSQTTKNPSSSQPLDLEVYHQLYQSQVGSYAQIPTPQHPLYLSKAPAGSANGGADQLVLRDHQVFC